MTHKEYNGWTNYHTWLVALWIDTEQGSFDYWRERVEEVCRDNVDVETNKVNRLEAYRVIEDALKESFAEAQPEVTGFWADMMNSALSEVNWREVAEHYIDELADEVDKELHEEEEAQFDHKEGMES